MRSSFACQQLLLLFFAGAVRVPACLTVLLLFASSSAANKITGASYSPSTPAVGSDLTVTVTGEPGTIASSAVVVMTPAVLPTWPAGSFQLLGSNITWNDATTGKPVHVTDYLQLPPSYARSLNQAPYTATFRFLPLQGTATTSTVQPAVYIASGTQYKHATVPTTTLASIPAPINFVTVRAAVSGVRLPSGGRATVTFTISNLGAPAGQAPVTISSLILANASLLGCTPVAGSTAVSSGSYPGDPVAGGGNIGISDVVVASNATVTGECLPLLAHCHPLQHGPVKNSNELHLPRAVRHLPFHLSVLAAHDHRPSRVLSSAHARLQ